MSARAVVLCCLMLLAARSAQAGLSRAALASVSVAPPANARLDLSLSARDANGNVQSVNRILAGRPAFVNFVDFTCNTLCGTDLMLLADGLRRAGLDPSQYRILVIGIDPKDSAKSAIAMEHAELPPALWPATVLFLPDQKTLAGATAALGFRYAYDAAIDQFAHPAVVYAIGPDGKLRGTFSPMSLLAGDLRAAIGAASSPPNFFKRVWLLCYAHSPLTGRYSARIQVFLKIAAAATLALLTLFVVLLARRRRPSA